MGFVRLCLLKCGYTYLLFWHLLRQDLLWWQKLWLREHLLQLLVSAMMVMVHMVLLLLLLLLLLMMVVMRSTMATALIRYPVTTASTAATI